VTAAAISFLANPRMATDPLTTQTASRDMGTLPPDPTRGQPLRHVLVRTVSSRVVNPADAVQVALGLLWLLDGILQLQPAMFTARFAREVILPAADGQPGFVAWPIHQAAHLILWAPGPINAVSALIQIGIGIGLMFRRSVRVAIVLSLVWSLNVWILGEGMGGLGGGKVMVLTGAPGAVLLYAVLAAAVWPEHDRPARWLTGAWVSLWVGGAILQVLPSQGSNRAIRASVSANADSAPGWLRSVDHTFLSALPSTGRSVVIGLVALQLIIGLAALAPRSYRVGGIVLGIMFAAVAWIIGESLGTYWTGLATDPNSAPLIALMALGVLATRTSEPRLQAAVPARSLPVFVDEAKPCGMGTRLQATAHAELAQDRRDVMTDRLLGENETIGDLGVAQPLRNQ
jgi:hypothetical protein